MGFHLWCNFSSAYLLVSVTKRLITFSSANNENTSLALMSNGKSIRSSLFPVNENVCCLLANSFHWILFNESSIVSISSSSSVKNSSNMSSRSSLVYASSISETELDEILFITFFLKFTILLSLLSSLSDIFPRCLLNILRMKRSLSRVSQEVCFSTERKI